MGTAVAAIGTSSNPTSATQASGNTLFITSSVGHEQRVPGERWHRLN